MFPEDVSTEIEEILSRYPHEHRRAAVMPLLYLAQRNSGYLTQSAIDDVADILDLDPTQVGGLVRFYTLFHDKPGGKYRIQVCTDLPCALRGAEDFSQAVLSHLGVELDQITEDGLFSVENVMCVAACHRAPVFQVQDETGIHFHEDQTEESATLWIDATRKGPAA